MEKLYYESAYRKEFEGTVLPANRERMALRSSWIRRRFIQRAGDSRRILGSWAASAFWTYMKKTAGSSI